MALLASPSLLSMETALALKKRNRIPEKITREYEMEKPRASPAAPINAIALGRIRSITAHVQHPTRILETILWVATESAPFLSFAPIRLDIAAPPPIPIPFAIAIARKKNGKVNPIADRESGPLPDTQIASARLYRVWNNIATIIGRDNLIIAFLGSPRSIFTPAVVFLSLEITSPL